MALTYILFPLVLQPFERYVETGRVAKATSGPLRGRLLTIVDVINQTRVSFEYIFLLKPVNVILSC